MIARCEAYATEKKLTPLSIAVVDESGTLIEFLRQPGASAGKRRRGADKGQDGCEEYRRRPRCSATWRRQIRRRAKPTR